MQPSRLTSVLVTLLLCVLAASAAVAGTADPQRAITGAYTIGQSGNDDCGVRLTASGGFYNISADPASSYTCPGGSYIVRITNSDPMPTGSNATGAKFVPFVNCWGGNPGTYLWPQQTIEVAVVGSAWMATRCPGRWVLPSGIMAFYYDPTHGSDTYGVADGLATGTRAFASANAALYTMGAFFDKAWENPSTTAITCANNGSNCSGITDTVGIHWSPHDAVPLGAAGRAAVLLNCNGGKIAPREPIPSLAMFFAGAIVEATGCTFKNGISVSEGAKFEDVAAGGNTYCGQPDQPIFALANGNDNLVWLSNVADICAGSVPHVIYNEGGRFQNGGTINFTGALSVKSTVFASSTSYTAFGKAAGGERVTGKKWNLLQSSYLSSTENVPGTAAGSTCSTCGTDATP
jgi:hypothetical protein